MKPLHRQILLSFFRQVLFWLIVFDCSRLVYAVYNLAYLKGVHFTGFLGVFVYSLPLDISAICYIMAIPFFITAVQNFYSSRWLHIISKVYVFIILLVIVVVTTVEAGVYSEWKTKLHYKALMYLAHPQEITGTAQTGQAVLLISLIVLQMALYYFIYLKFFFRRIIVEKRNIIFSAVFIILMPGMLFLGMRGGWRQIPINQSQSYYSKNALLNLVSVNSLWNLGNSIMQNYNMLDKNPYHYYDDKDARNTVRQLFEPCNDSTALILKTGKPNVVMFILEGWSADLIESQGGENGITPFFHELEKNGVLFTNIYASGTRSQEGMAAIFSGFPSLGITALTQQPEKYSKLPGLIRKMKDDGYFSSFYFGGQLIYGNIKSYMVNNGIDKLVEGDDFPSSMPRGKLGIHDEYTFPYFLNALNSQQQPFFSSIFTLSSHSPYDFNMKEVFSWPQYEKPFVNSAYYVDKCLESFFRQAKQQSWYSNTLFVLISDHCHGSYRNYDFCSADYHKIVMLLCGDVINDEFKGKKVEKIGCQHDFPAVLSAQLGLKHSDFSWSKNLLQPGCPEFAFYAFDNGFGWVRPGGYLTFNAGANSNCMLEIDSTGHLTEEELARQAKSFMQCAFQQYMDF